MLPVPLPAAWRKQVGAVDGALAWTEDLGSIPSSATEGSWTRWVWEQTEDCWDHWCNCSYFSINFKVGFHVISCYLKDIYLSLKFHNPWLVLPSTSTLDNPPPPPDLVSYVPFSSRRIFSQSQNKELNHQNETNSFPQLGVANTPACGFRDQFSSTQPVLLVL